MSRLPRLLTSMLCLASSGFYAFAQEVSPLSEAAEPEPEAGAPAEVEAEAEVGEETLGPGTKAYDAETVSELFQELKVENQRRAEQMAPHMNADNLDVIELAPVNVDPYEVRNMDMLVRELDPQPRKRLQRLAELDPQAAADLQVSIRSEERFFVGEMDPIDSNAGTTANFDAIKVSESVAAALDKAKAALRQKKATDDQKELPTEAP